MNKPILLLVVIGVLVSGCAKEVEPTDNIYAQYPKVNRVLVDIAMSEDPVETARKTGRLAETQAELSRDKPIEFRDGRIYVVVYLKDIDTPFPKGYDVTIDGELGNSVGVWIPPNQILKLSKEPSVLEISFSAIGVPEIGISEEEMSYE